MIIGIGGELESGKDTVAEYLVKNYGYTRKAFADNLKFMCMKVFGLTRDQCFTTKGKKVLFENKIHFEREHGVEIIQWLTEVNQWKVKMTDTYLLDDIISRKVEFESSRNLLQFIGTEVMRDCFDPDIHAKIVFKEIEIKGLTKVAIADARFPNERKFISLHNGRLICVQNPNLEESNKPKHRSESSMGDDSEYDIIIYNDKTEGLEKLYKKIEHSMKLITRPINDVTV